MKKDEVQLACPRCGHPNFYFNLSKQVGYCHSAHCHWTPNRSQLDQVLQQKGRRLHGVKIQKTEEEEEAGPLEFDADVVPLLRPDLRAHCELCEETVQHLETDRRVPRELQFRMGLRASENRIYVPVYEENVLQNYVGRAKWWINSDCMRYRYAPGRDISQFIYSWDVFRVQPELALVENTFNALWLRPHGVSTNFGSNLSAAQIEKFRLSRVRRVVLLWDEGAAAKAEKAAAALNEAGVKALFVRIEGQPDGHREECIVSLIQAGMRQLIGGSAVPIDVRHEPCVR